MKSVLVVEDDTDILELLRIHLKDLDCWVDETLNGTEGLEKAQASVYDLIVLDLMLPGTNGLTVCQKLRALEIQTPILMLTAKSEEFDKVMGLESGADDYLTKPFSIRELIARIKAIFRRQEMRIVASSKENSQRQTIKKAKLEMDIQKRKVSIGQRRVSLTPKEFDLLLLLVKNPGISYDRDSLLSAVWGYEFSGYEHTVNSHINRLRNKIEDDASNPHYILTTWGVGYRFNDEL